MHYCMQEFLVCEHEKLSQFLQGVRFIFKIAKTLASGGFRGGGSRLRLPLLGRQTDAVTYDTPHM